MQRDAEGVPSNEYPRSSLQRLLKFELLFKMGIPSPFILIVFGWQSTQREDDKESDKCDVR